MFHDLNLELSLPLSLFWVKNLIVSVVFVPVISKWDDYNIAFTITMTIKHGKLKCTECTNKRDELYDVFTY
jgi:hypothetical protein